MVYTVPSSCRPSEFSLPVAGALQAHEQETSRVLMLIDTTSGQLIADLIAIGGRQMLVPREHPPDRPKIFRLAGHARPDDTIIIFASETRQSHGEWITGRTLRTLLASCRRAAVRLKVRQSKKTNLACKKTIKRSSQILRNLGAEQKSESADCTIMCVSTQDSQISELEPSVARANLKVGWTKHHGIQHQMQTCRCLAVVRFATGSLPIVYT